MQVDGYVLEIVTDTVCSAGKIIKNRLGGSFKTGFKSSPADLVTEIDRQSQGVILEGLTRAFPDHRIVAEEDFSEDELTLNDRPAWFVDPLDGTTNFVFGIPFCTVSVALAMKGKPVLGVVYDPLREELFTALQGQGAYLNKKRIQVDHRRNSLGESLLVTGFPSSDRFKRQMLKTDFAGIFSKAGNVRALGSAALELAYIACGRLTGYWEVTLRPWDVAAGMILVEEAGGQVSNLYGDKLMLGNFVSIVASNSLIHEELVRELGFYRIK